jgi:hypothetical protein
MDVRRAHLQGVFEQGLQQAHNRRFFSRLGGRQGAEIDDLVASSSVRLRASSLISSVRR